MNITENKKRIEIAPAIGIGIILVLVALAGLLFYKGLLSIQQEESGQAVPVDVSAAREEASVPSEPETIEQELELIEQELEEVSVEVSGTDLFGLEELDAELIDFTELDEIFNFEL